MGRDGGIPQQHLGHTGSEGSVSHPSPVLLCKRNVGSLKKSQKKNNRMANRIKIALINANNTPEPRLSCNFLIM